MSAQCNFHRIQLQMMSMPSLNHASDTNCEANTIDVVRWHQREKEKMRPVGFKFDGINIRVYIV